MDPTLITKIATAGAMGVSIYCIIKVYELLRNEQKKEIPRKEFLVTIYVSMAFAIVMTFVSLGIEIVRNHLEIPSEKITAQLERIGNENYFSIDKNGIPQKITFDFKDSVYVISHAYPKSKFKNSELKIQNTPENKYIAIKNVAGDSISMGYIESQEMKNKSQILFEEDIKYAIEPDELWSLILFYTPTEELKVIEYDTKKDKFKSANHLLQYLDHKQNNDKMRKDYAAKLITQPKLREILQDDQLDELISQLEKNIRQKPYNYYDLSQVYLGRLNENTDEKSKKRYLEKYKQNLNAYVQYYEKNKWLEIKGKDNLEYEWYVESKKELSQR